ncbi:hypothetical protein KIN20_034423 [Parelaphostrongylus tenuis]|uniref:Uncharacterized protein n=1 Tax=Parelaphostrongylus tenuis TaxID=148309 RepID=A0AAD5R9N0_PARTN|nr:hypothetical protein KIN20_034423 [Parelaphostrongylus tenuis]
MTLCHRCAASICYGKTKRLNEDSFAEQELPLFQTSCVGYRHSKRMHGLLSQSWKSNPQSAMCALASITAKHIHEFV